MLQLISLLLPVVDKLIPDPAKQAKAQTELIKALSEHKEEIYTSMKEVMVADANSDSIYTKAARPTIVYWSLAMVTFIVVLSPFGHEQVILESLAKVPEALWQLMTVGIGAYVFGRSGEKMFRNWRK